MTQEEATFLATKRGAIASRLKAARQWHSTNGTPGDDAIKAFSDKLDGIVDSLVKAGYCVLCGTSITPKGTVAHFGCIINSSI